MLPYFKKSEGLVASAEIVPFTISKIGTDADIKVHWGSDIHDSAEPPPGEVIASSARIEIVKTLAHDDDRIFMVPIRE